jgi:hypothetical protein
MTSFGRPLNGASPVFLMSVGNANAGTIPVLQSDPDALGWLGQKTPWFVERSYTGPLLIRGGRVDEPGPVRFAKVYGQHLSELRFRTGENNGIAGSFRFLASTSLFRASGCYAFQVDGTSFSKVIVMRVANRTY